MTPQPEPAELLRCALELAELGWAVYPIYERAAPGVCGCGCAHPHCWEKAKHPRLTDAETDRFHTPAEIERFWRLWPEANIGIHCERSGLLVIDVDRGPHGEDRLPDLVEHFGEQVTDTLTAATGGGGWHLYFSLPDSLPLRTMKGRLGPGIDLQRRSTAPPSGHPSGGRFTWKDGVGPRDRPPAPLPEALRSFLERRPPAAWYARQAPYELADRLHLSMDARQRLRWLQHMGRRHE